ncbi:MAG: transglutaminase domain-containing protein [Anaerolineaceae bacterium]|nr:transglutaminase domain-containing protein [Anaerolineaceae bacterium]
MKLNNQRIGDLLTHILLLAALLTISWRLEATEWIPGLERISWLMISGYLLGALLGFSSFKFPIVLLLTVGYTIVGVTWQALSLIEGTTLVFRDVLIQFIDRLNLSFYAFLNNLPVEDPVLFYVSLGILIWLTSVFVAYFFIRKKTPWVALFLCAIYLLLIEYFPPYLDHPGRYLGFFVLLVFIIVGRVWYLKEQERWIEKGYRIDSETGFNILKSIAFSSLVVVLISWNVPTISELFIPGSEPRANISESWINFRSRVSNMFASLEAPFYSATDYYEDTLSLGSNIPVGYETLFMVQVPERDDLDVRFYWHGHSFDTYRSGEWINTLNDRQQVSGSIFNEALILYTARKAVDLEFELKANFSKTFYLPMIPEWVDQSVFIVGREEFGEDDLDLMSVQPLIPLKRGDKYQARIHVSQPTVMQLRNAGTKYPDWVLETYLQLPENFPIRIQELASEIVADAKTPYDQVAAITRYLRTEIIYEPLLVLPPQAEEPIEWMLFDSKIGFCNYYATAEVLMLRSIGVPARFAAGYAQGEPAGDSYYNVRVRDSHAWPEVYFPGVGWVEFEPTSAQPVRDLPIGEPVTNVINAASVTGENIFSSSEPEKDIDAFLDEEGIIELTPTVWDMLGKWIWLIILTSFVLGIVLINRYVLVPRRKTIAGVLRSSVDVIGLGIPNWLDHWAAYADLIRIHKIDAQLTWLCGLIDIDINKGDTVRQKYTQLKQLIPDVAGEVEAFVELFHENQYHEMEIDSHAIETRYRRIRKALISHWYTYKFRF